MGWKEKHAPRTTVHGGKKINSALLFSLFVPVFVTNGTDSTKHPSLWVVSAHAGGLIAALGGIVWLTGQPFLFPSLGPTAFVLSYQPEKRLWSAWTVIGSHFWGTIAGLASYHLFASGITLMDATGRGTATLPLAASATCATVLTSALMIGTRSVHPPACATTLIVALGLMTTLIEGSIIVLAVTLLYGLSWGLTTSWED